MREGDGMNNRDEIKPCPFCGGKAKLRYSKPFSVAVCTRCNAHGKIVVDREEEGDGKEEALSAWNRRKQAGAYDESQTERIMTNRAYITDEEGFKKMTEQANPGDEKRRKMADEFRKNNVDWNRRNT